MSGFSPLVEQWFASRFAGPTEPQRAGWPLIAADHDVLIAAPTGSGKTLTAFLICLDRLIRQAIEGNLSDETQVVYVSPLKALTTDIQQNLEIPLAQIRRIAEDQGLALPTIRTAVRTGDTPAHDRQRMGRKPPHILITTPESLYILLTADRSRRMLTTARTVITDEVHAVAGNKRGSHLALSLARLHALCGSRLQAIGLSATVKPVDEVARFLSPSAHIVNIGHRRDMDLAVEVPRDELGPITTNEMWAGIYDRIAELIRAHRTTLVFVNTRRMAERLAHALGERVGNDQVLAHHGSLARAVRFAAEDRLRRGELRAVVATASLELGIDIGNIDLAIQVGSPRSISAGLQRIGRSGHWAGATPKGRIFVTTRDELIECAALVSAIGRDELERIEIPENALDILAQQIVAETAAESWSEDGLYNLIRSAYPYRSLERKDFDEVVEMLSEGIATSRGRSGAMLHRDQVNHRIRGRRGSRLVAITSGGAIAENAAFTVVVEPDGRSIGTVDEDFATESMAGDVFLLGTHSWRIKRVESAGRLRVEDAFGAKPSVPFWLGEAPGRSSELSAAVSRLRQEIARVPLADARGSVSSTAPNRDHEGADSAEHLLRSQCGLDEAGARQAIAYVSAGQAALGVLPSQSTVVAERFFDEAGGMQLVLHAPFGARVNRAWGLSLRKRLCRTFNFELQTAATDNGIVVSLSQQHAFPLELVFELLNPEMLQSVLTDALLTAPMFTSRWRWNATRALAVRRFAGGRKVPPAIQRMRSDDLLAAVFPDQVACFENLTGPPSIPDHPLVNETIANCLFEAMDLNVFRRLIAGMRDGSIRTIAVETTAASPFSHEILNSNPYTFLDDAPLEERRARAVQLRSILGPEVVGPSSILDPAAIAQVAQESWPLIRDADELHDALLTLITMPPQPEHEHLYQNLVRAGRARSVVRDGKEYWIATERLALANDPVETLRGWMESIGPATASALAGRLSFPEERVTEALRRLEAEGQALQGRFTGVDVPLEWCNRRILARIHRLTLGRLRREIEPVSALQFEHFLRRWQHREPGTQLHGADGTLEIIRQLQGYEIPSAAWEFEVFPHRIAGYKPEFLDELCLSGEVTWGRLSPHPALEGDGRHVRPTRIAPISFFLREDADWLVQPVELGSNGLSHAAREVLAALERSGASFFMDLVRGAHRLASEVEDALWELVAAGLVTADGFENLRALLDPKRRRGEGRGRRARPRHAAGRWAPFRRTSAGVSAQERVERLAEQFLLRWGVVFRDVLAHESLAPPWRDLLLVLRRKEAQGMIRGGRFVEGFTGEQFARPEALDLLRRVRREESEVAGGVPITGPDPLNLTGTILPASVG